MLKEKKVIVINKPFVATQNTVHVSLMGIFDSSPKKMGVYTDQNNRVILHKTEHIGVVQKTHDKKFMTTFEELTKEGYRLMAIDVGTFYFQKIK